VPIELVLKYILEQKEEEEEKKETRKRLVKLIYR
jgi:hypothetical protein